MIKGDGYSREDDFITKDECLFCAKKWNVVMLKEFLIILEDLKKEHQINFEKLKKSVPNSHKEMVEMADYFGEQKFAYLRKKSLDSGGNAFRNLENDIKNL